TTSTGTGRGVRARTTMTSAPAATATMTATTMGRGMTGAWPSRGVVGSPKGPLGRHTFVRRRAQRCGTTFRLIRAAALSGRLHLHDRHGEIADGLAVD